LYLLILRAEDCCCIWSPSRTHTHTHTHTHNRQDFSGWGIGPSQRPLPDNTQNSQEIDIHASAAFERAIPSCQ